MTPVMQCPGCHKRDVIVQAVGVLDKHRLKLETVLVVLSGLALFVGWLADPSLSTPLMVVTPLLLLLYWWLGYDWLYNLTEQKWVRFHCRHCRREWTWTSPLARDRRTN